MRRVPIRLKLAIALAVPLAALGLVTAMEVLRAAGAVDDVRDQTELAAGTLAPRALLTALQDERAYATLDLTGLPLLVPEPRRGFDVTRGATDEAARAFRDELARANPAVQEAYAPAVAGLATLDEGRVVVDRYGGPRYVVDSAISAGRDAFNRYTAIITPLLDAATSLASSVDDAELREGAELVATAARQDETVAQLFDGLVYAVHLTDGGLDSVEEISHLARLRSDFELHIALMRAGTGRYADVADRTFDHDLVDRISELLDEAVATGQADVTGGTGAAGAGVAHPFAQGFDAYQDGIADAVTDRAGELDAAAATRQRWLMVVAAVTIVAATGLTWVVSRSITRPLRSLTGQARDMAEHRLPDAVTGILETPLGDDVDVPGVDPVAVVTRDEVADVAEALNRVQVTALDLAVEQAVLRRNIADSFVNLGRRNQNLLRRQLDFITQLETHEADADTLANLFRLDHLATRMRRNAESLLVLAGIAPARQWAVAVRITEVIRAALGEVEDFQRVAVRGVDPATVLGSAASDMAHLLAELLENALVFSPPDRPVDVTGRRRPEGYTVAVSDAGHGMPAQEIEAANRRLAGAESFTVAPSKYLGHYVAGSLAARHGISIRLATITGYGITATVDLPPDLLTGEQAPGLAHPRPRGPAGDPRGGPHPAGEHRVAVAGGWLSRRARPRAPRYRV
jgi:signal transduction histidine kinase